MIQKKDCQNTHDKVIKNKKKRKFTNKNILTAMTSHVKKEMEPEEEAEDNDA